VVKVLNQWFDGVFVHSDPELIKLDETFVSIKQVKVPVVYTGFITSMPDPAKVDALKSLKMTPETSLIVASAGGGSVGARLLRSVVQAHELLSEKQGQYQLKVFTGPYMDKADKKWLSKVNAPDLRVEEFSPDFVSLLAAADLSISMAGYNTCMNIVAAGVPSLVWPFNQNHEQRNRAEKLSGFIPMRLLEDTDLDPEQLAEIIRQQLNCPSGLSLPRLELNGASVTVKHLERH
jgi:predicted glycosyltransferase